MNTNKNLNVLNLNADSKRFIEHEDKNLPLHRRDRCIEC